MPLRRHGTRLRLRHTTRRSATLPSAPRSTTRSSPSPRRSTAATRSKSSPPTTHAQAEWLDIVTTTKAKQAIKSFLKRERQHNIERGMKMLEERDAALNINAQRSRAAQNRPDLRMQQQGGALQQNRGGDRLASTTWRRS